MKVNSAKGLFWDENNKELSLQEALDGISECDCGFNCCENAFYIGDTSTGDKMKVQVTDGSIVITNVTNPE